MATCTITGTFTDQAEAPLEGVRVSVYVPPTPVTSVAAQERTYESDDAGLVSFDLVQGIRVRVSILQRGLSREFDVPAEDTADLFTLLSDVPDPFTVAAT